MKLSEQNDVSAQVLYLPQALLRETYAYFLPYWQASVETACYWFGVESEDTQIAITLAIPRLFQTAGSYRVDTDSVRQLGKEMRGQGLVNLAQIHTHPTGCGVRHSPYDDEHAYSTREGALSLVWPDYGLTLSHTLADIGVHERRGGRWILLSETEVAERIRLVESMVDKRWDILPGTSKERRDVGTSFEPSSRRS